jgi:hypothetical protein
MCVKYGGDLVVFCTAYGFGGLSFGLFPNQPYHLALPLPPY